MVLAALGFAVFTRVDETSGFPIFLAGSVLFSLGLAPVFTLAIDLIVGAAPPERAGAASGIAETSAEFGGALGIALFGSIGIAIYRGAMETGIPTDVPPEAAEVAQDTLGGAVEIAGQLPDRLGAPLIDTAREAFIHGVHLAAGISVVGALGLAIFVAVLLRRMGGGSEPERQNDPDKNTQTESPAAA
jgi:DHA2 family multidrug resistance protein-like MFS transporter